MTDITEEVTRNQEKIAIIEELNKEKSKLAEELARLKHTKK